MVHGTKEATDRLDEEKFGPSLLFLRIQNAAAEARAAGRETNARWCENVVSRLDPEGKNHSPEALTKLPEYVNVLLGNNTYRDCMPPGSEEG